MFSSWHDFSELPDAQAIVSTSEQTTWARFLANVTSQAAAFEDLAGLRVALPLQSSAASLTQMFALATAGAHVFLLAADSPPQRIETWAADFSWTVCLAADGALTEFLPAEASSAKSDSVTILTSGTSGQPKAVEHTWQSLRRPVRTTTHGQRWLLTYRPHLYAGLQVILQCLANRGTLVLPEEDSTAHDVSLLCRDAQVRYASATPSYWRWLLSTAQAELLGAIPFEQITLGGEAVDQSTLDSLGKVFPQTRLVHIYATTELGRCFSVTDGLAGFPLRFLEAPSKDGIQMKIDDGELVVRSANAMNQYDRSGLGSPRDEWFRTGDLVTVVEDRVQFVGRNSDMINVGGNKVFPVVVENVVRSVAGVADVRVYGEDSSLVGQLVKCELVVRPGFDQQAVEAAVREKTRESLDNYQRPRLIAIVDEIPRTAAGKAKRD